MAYLGIPSLLGFQSEWIGTVGTTGSWLLFVCLFACFFFHFAFCRWNSLKGLKTSADGVILQGRSRLSIFKQRQILDMGYSLLKTPAALVKSMEN